MSQKACLEDGFKSLQFIKNSEVGLGYMVFKITALIFFHFKSNL